MNFNGHCPIKNNISIAKKVINLYISYTLALQLRNLNTAFKSGNCLFGSVKLIKNADPDKYEYSRYGIRFDSRSESSVIDGNIGRNVICASQGLVNTTLTAEAKYPINFTQSGKRFVLSLHYNGINSFLFVNATKVYQFKAINYIRNKRFCAAFR